MSVDAQSLPTETRSLCARKEKTKKEFLEKEFPETVVAGRLVVCNRRAARQAQIVTSLASRSQLEHTTRHKSCHLLRLICMSVDAQSRPNETRSLCARKEKTKKEFLEKEFPETVVAGRLFVCNRRAARQAQIVARLASRLYLTRTTIHKSCHLLLVICKSFDEQSPPTETRSL
jgi:ssRNA-specific RNase YbeY (16S rRNA maturation enzyme)